MEKKHRLQYRNADWDKINARRERLWAEKAGEVVVTQAADPEKVKAYQEKKKLQEQEEKKTHEKNKKEFYKRFNKYNNRRRQGMFEGDILP
jgi:hypothetical protein